MNVTKRRERKEAKRKKHLADLIARDEVNRGVVTKVAPPVIVEKKEAVVAPAEIQVSLAIKPTETNPVVAKPVLAPEVVPALVVPELEAPVAEEKVEPEQEEVSSEEIDAPVFEKAKKKGGRKKKS